MNQTTWIIGGSIVILLVAVLLYMFTGDSVSQNTKKSVAEKAQQETLNNKQTEKKENTPEIINKQTTKMPEQANMEYREALIKTTAGDISVRLYAADAPKTIENFTKLAKEGFYVGTRFHRVIKDFMIQGGDPLSKDESQKARWGSGGPGYTFADEINAHKLVRGSLAMANAGPNTNGSQFFIVTKQSTPWLDGKHTNFGEVVAGMDVVDKIEAAQTGANDQPVDPVKILSVEIR
jgi:cyclophilin family peptidyl-prolyl cis-trans isomerase